MPTTKREKSGQRHVSEAEIRRRRFSKDENPTEDTDPAVPADEDVTPRGRAKQKRGTQEDAQAA